MQNKLQELTEKIYQEGIEKGNEEAKSIIEAAKKKAVGIVESAEKEAELIVKSAEKIAIETKNNTETELKLSSKQAINALKQQITDVLNSEVIGSATGSAFDSEFTKKIIETTLINWTKNQSSDLSVLIPIEQEKEFLAHFNKSIKDLLDEGLEIKSDSSVKSGFQIAPQDGSYKVSFTEEDFNNLFRQYLRPKLVDLLFNK